MVCDGLGSGPRLCQWTKGAQVVKHQRDGPKPPIDHSSPTPIRQLLFIRQLHLPTSPLQPAGPYSLLYPCEACSRRSELVGFGAI